MSNARTNNGAASPRTSGRWGQNSVLSGGLHPLAMPAYPRVSTSSAKTVVATSVNRCTPDGAGGRSSALTRKAAASAQRPEAATFFGMPRPPRRFPLALLALATVAAACGDADSVQGASTTASIVEESTAPGEIPADAVAIRASTDIGLGRERLLIGVGGPNGERLILPDRAAVIEVAPQDDSAAIQRSEAEWTWIVLNGVGLFRAHFEFDQPGIWTADIILEDGPDLAPVAFEVLADPAAPALGETAPAAPTPTLDDLPIDELTTDPSPDTRFYELSLQEALANGQPTVLVFSTPAYCRTSACGPLLDNIKEIAPDHPDVNFVHVEVFTDLKDPDFAPDGAHLAPAVGPEWFNLPSEPWVFVLDPDGVVIGRFEGVLDPAEVTALLR